MNPNDIWLEPELRRHLTRVPAPSHLRPPRLPCPAARRSPKPWVWVLATAASLLAVSWGYYPLPREIRSSSATDIRAWIQSRTGMQVPLAPDASIQLQGARIIDAELPIVEVRYQAAGHSAVMLVARSTSNGASQHNHTAATKWTMARQTYTLTSTHPGGLRAACLVCHTEAQI